MFDEFKKTIARTRSAFECKLCDTVFPTGAIVTKIELPETEEIELCEICTENLKRIL